MSKCFMVKKDGQVRVWWRRYSHASDSGCTGAPCGPGYHEAMALAGDFPAEVVFEKVAGRQYYSFRPEFEAQFPKDDPRWPLQCAHCGYVFTEADAKQVFDRWVWADDAGQHYTQDELPVGAMWLEDYLPDDFYWDNHTGGHLHVKTPGGTWNIDSRASNCTLPEDRQHRCWVRHGEPPNVHVDKDGHTCGAGAGSIQCGNYHGFLRQGSLT